MCGLGKQKITMSLKFDLGLLRWFQELECRNLDLTRNPAAPSP